MCEQVKDITRLFEDLVLDFCKTNLHNVINRLDGDKFPNMPDIEIENKLYIECTVAKKGKSSDGLTIQEPHYKKNVAAILPVIPNEIEQALMHFAHQRLANSLDSKNKQYERHKKNINFNQELARIVAITVDISELSKDYYFDYLYEDTLWKLLWDNGSNIRRQFYLDGSWADMPYKDGIEVKKQNGSTVPSGIFNYCKNNCNNISAILFISPNKIRQVNKDIKIEKEDIYLCVNKYAEIKITKDHWDLLLCPKILLEYPKCRRED